MGHQSDLYAMTIDDDLRGDVIPWTDPGATRGDLTILHFALVSPMTSAFARLASGRVLQYHNVTPAHFFAGYDAAIYRLAMLGREDLRASLGTPTSRSAIQNSTGRSSNRSASPTPECFRLRSIPGALPTRRGVPLSKKC
jgi:hypothetical protein